MDERHWWIATKLQETFKAGALDGFYASFLEDFLADPNTVDHINNFLSPGGHTKLFFYALKGGSVSRASANAGPQRIHVASSAVKLKEVLSEEAICVVFLRANINRDIEPGSVEREIFVLELKHNVLGSFSDLLSRAFLPFLKARSDWGETVSNEVNEFLYHIEKYSTTLQDYSEALNVPHQILKRPDMLVTNDFKQNRALAVNSAAVAAYEQLVQDWMQTIEGLLLETSEGRMAEVFSGPLSEVEQWQRRQKLLHSVTDQLKNKECKTVIGILITAKSRILKRWKVVDAGLTDALNETKDKVKYLDSLRRHFEQLYQDNSPTFIANTTLPSLSSSVRQMDAISRFYARTGFLGTVFNKVTNQLVSTCKSFLTKTLKKSKSGESEKFWTIVEKELSSITSIEPSTGTKSKRGNSEPDKLKESFLARLHSCATLHKQYVENLCHLRDGLGGVNSLQHVPGPAIGAALAKKAVSASQGNISTSPSRILPSTVSPYTFGHDRLRIGGAQSSVSTVYGALTGIAFTDDEQIIGHLDRFIQRVRSMIDIIETLKQLNDLVVSTRGLPIFSSTERSMTKSQSKSLEIVGHVTDKQAENELAELKEHDEEARTDDDEEIETVLTDDQPKSMDSMLMEDTSVSRKLQMYVVDIKSYLESSVDLEMFLNVEGKDKHQFEDAYSVFVKKYKGIEEYITNYLKIEFCSRHTTTSGLLSNGNKQRNSMLVFQMNWQTKKSVDILSSFSSVITRPGLRSVFSEKYIEIFVAYERDLEEVQNTYETHKEHPPLARNSPLAAGAIFWSRGLLKRIEAPMKIFREVKFVSQLKDFSRVVKVYNRIATVLVKFEELWVNAWKSQVEVIRQGLKAPLLKYDGQKKDIFVNADERILELISEVKWLQRLNITVPENALEIAKQESRFKNYFHQLNWLLKLYHNICDQVPSPLRKLMAPLTESVQYYLHPGLSTLTWNSMNIDAFLHQCHSALNRLKATVENVCELVAVGLDQSILEIKKLVLFQTEQVTWRGWQVNEFVANQKSFLQSETRELHLRVQSIEAALQNLAMMVSDQIVASVPPSPSPTSSRSTPAAKRSYSRASQQNQTVLLPPSTSFQQSNKSTRAALSPMSGVVDESILAELKVYYCSQVYDAVLTSTVKSLESLLECVTWKNSINLSDSLLSQLVEATSLVQFNVNIQFALPDIRIEPSLEVVQSIVNKLTKEILGVSKTVYWWAADEEKSFHSSIAADKTVVKYCQAIDSSVLDLHQSLEGVLLYFRRFDFLWQDDLQVLFKAFVEANPGTHAFHREVDRLQKIEQDLLSVPKVLHLGSISLNTIPVKDSLHGFAVAWKVCYAQPLHDSAKEDLQKIIEKREEFRGRLTADVSSLSQLNEVLILLQELHDMENTIDDVYLPVETTYSKLLSYGITIPRTEVQEVDGLRDKWSELLSLAEEVRTKLLSKKRAVFEQELDKQVKTFVVEVIQFRNSFDSQGPGVPGVSPSEAVRRLTSFHEQFEELACRRKVLDDVQVIFGIVPTPFPELDKTGEELELLGMLYGLFQRFISFDQKFRDRLWAEADLSVANNEIKGYWRECLELPVAIRNWNAYKEMRDAIQSYLDVFPLLNKLASKEIRNRHWLQVMAVTGSSFQLEANVFKLMHLLDIGLVKHKEEIEEIVKNAEKELDLEVKIRAIEEEWTEQVLLFEKFKGRGLVCLDKTNTEKLLEMAEDAKAMLAVMLTSKHVAPLREEAASWAVKLKEVGEVLEQWLSVQELWQCLEEVFSSASTARELPQEYSRFARIDRGYMKMMKRAVELRNVMQCCIGGEVPKSQVLKGLLEELEICFKSLAGYLNNKRSDFPRFYFVTDSALLSMLSKPYNLESVKPYLGAIFSGINDIHVKTIEPVSRGSNKKHYDLWNSRISQTSLVSISEPNFKRLIEYEQGVLFLKENAF